MVIALGARKRPDEKQENDELGSCAVVQFTAFCRASWAHLGSIKTDPTWCSLISLG